MPISDLDGRKTQLGYTPKSKSNRIRKQLTEKEFENEAIVPGECCSDCFCAFFLFCISVAVF